MLRLHLGYMQTMSTIVVAEIQAGLEALFHTYTHAHRANMGCPNAEPRTTPLLGGGGESRKHMDKLMGVRRMRWLGSLGVCFLGSTSRFWHMVRGYTLPYKCQT